MNRRIFLTVIACVFLCVFSGATDLVAGGAYLNLSIQPQEHSQWSWAACCQCILRFYGANPSQCGIVNYAFSRTDCCGNSTFNWFHSCNYSSTLTAIVSVLQYWGVNAYSTGSLTWTAVKSNIDNSHPFIIARSGHTSVGYGYWTANSTDYIGYMDPWPGEGGTWSVYSSYVNGWFGSVLTY